MAYPYGTQGAPAVGNGLGGLPRRAVAAAAAAAASTRRYDLQLIANSPTSFTTYATNSKSVAIMLGGKIYKYYRTDFTPEVYRWKADYSSSGYANVSDTNLGTSTITQLPISSNTLQNNYCWSIEYSATSGLFCYSGLPPFLVTVSGSDTSYTSVSFPQSGTYENGGTWSSMSTFVNTAIISKDGQLLMVGRDNANYIALLRFNPQTLAFIGATTQSTNAFPTSTSYPALQIYTTSYGYLVGWSAMTGSNGYVGLTNFSDSYVPVSHGRRQVTASGLTITGYGITVGPQGASALFGTSDGTQGTVAGVYASPTGVITAGSSLTTNGTMGGFTSSTYQGMQMKFLRATMSATEQGAFYEGTNIDGTLKAAFISAAPTYGNSFVPYGASGTSYFHIDTQPFVENDSPYNSFKNIETLCIKTGLSMANQYCPGFCGDNNGFIYIPNTYGSEGNQLLKKVYR